MRKPLALLCPMLHRTLPPREWTHLADCFLSSAASDPAVTPTSKGTEGFSGEIQGSRLATEPVTSKDVCMVCEAEIMPSATQPLH